MSDMPAMDDEQHAEPIKEIRYQKLGPKHIWLVLRHLYVFFFTSHLIVSY